jgi:uncharacterized protein HemY
MYLRNAQKNPKYSKFTINDDELKAIKCLEIVANSFPDNYEVLRMLGHLYLKQNKKVAAYTALKRGKKERKERKGRKIELISLVTFVATELQPDDIDALLEVAKLIENDPPLALKYYQVRRASV